MNDLGSILKQAAMNALAATPAGEALGSRGFVVKGGACLADITYERVTGQIVETVASCPPPCQLDDPFVLKVRDGTGSVRMLTYGSVHEYLAVEG